MSRAASSRGTTSPTSGERPIRRVLAFTARCRALDVETAMIMAVHSAFPDAERLDDVDAESPTRVVMKARQRHPVHRQPPPRGRSA